MQSVLGRGTSLQQKTLKLVFKMCLKVVALREIVGIRGMGEVQVGHSLYSIRNIF